MRKDSIALCAKLARLELDLKPLWPKSQAQPGEVKTQLLLHSHRKRLGWLPALVPAMLPAVPPRGEYNCDQHEQLVAKTPFAGWCCTGLTPEISKGPLKVRAAMSPKYVPFSISPVFESQRCTRCVNFPSVQRAGYPKKQGWSAVGMPRNTRLPQIASACHHTAPGRQ